MYGILVGLVFTYVAATWGAYLYMVNVIALHVLLLLLLRDYDMKVLETYISFFITMFIGVSIVPKWGIRTFLSMSLALLWVPFIMALVEYIVEKMPQIGSRIPSDRKVLLPYMVFGAIVLIGGVVLALGILGRMSARYLSVINPALRKLIPLVESVGEHRAPTWASLFFDFSTTGVLGVMGIYFTLRRISRENLFAAVFGLSSLYAAASMARLTLLASPALCLLGGIAFAEFINPIRDTLRGAASVSRRRKKVTPTIGPIHGVIALSSLALIILMQILSPFLVAAFASPPLILTSSVPANERYNYEYIDWVSALEWVRDNLPEDAVIASWWDYGYWIAVAGNRTSVCDNSTINSTQIKLIARAFLSSEEEAIKIFKALGVKYVIVFEPYINLNTLLGLRIPFPIYVPHFRGYGDFGKSIWMARIAGLNERKYVTNGTISIDRVITFTIITPADTPEARNATLYKLLFYPVKGRRFIFNIGKEILRYIGIDWRGPDVNFEAPKYFRLVFASRPNAYVLIYEVLYEEAEEA
ncbi:MAG: hypothetical protein DRM97_04895 [Thermoprotei archaeon]|nr:MAG: hypothetical protein DRM97_04895 [Thermoprotei archaeon]